MSENRLANHLLIHTEMIAMVQQLNELKLNFAQSKNRKTFTDAFAKEEASLNTYCKEILDEAAEREESGGYKFTDDTKKFIKLIEGKAKDYQDKLNEAYNTKLELPKLSLDIINQLTLSPMQFLIVDAILNQES